MRIWTAEDDASEFEEGVLRLPGGNDGDSIGAAFPAASISFRETKPEDALAWHTAPVHQLVLTLSGTLEFQVRDGRTFIIRPGDVLLAEDTAGSGHRWRLIGSEPWRRAYVIVPDGVEAAFVATT